MEYQVVGRSDIGAVLARFNYEPYVDGHWMLTTNPLEYSTLATFDEGGRRYVTLERSVDRAIFTVPVFRSIAQLRAYTRITREPRRLYHEEAQEVSYFSRRKSHEIRLQRLAVGAPLQVA